MICTICKKDLSFITVKGNNYCGSCTAHRMVMYDYIVSLLTETANVLDELSNNPDRSQETVNFILETTKTMAEKLHSFNNDVLKGK